MQTFLPHSNFYRSAEILDNKRLHKQALEAWQILMVLTKLDPKGNHREPKGWSNHPAVKMWRGSESDLALYALSMTLEWKSRGFNTTLDTKIQETYERADKLLRIGTVTPAWKGDDAVHSSHRVALLAKDYNHYKQFKWSEDRGVAPTRWEYVWPEGAVQIAN